MNDFVYSFATAKLASLGGKMVFSHGDLGMGNIFVDDNDKIGIIDFSESVYLDEAADFMDIEDDRLCQEVLNAYNADNTLREKVAIRRTFRPMFVIGTYHNRPENEIMRFVDKIREWLNQKTNLCYNISILTERNQIIEHLKNFAFPKDYVFAMWLEGADGLNQVDEYSDIDF